MEKRYLPLLLCFAVILSLFSGCVKEENQAPDVETFAASMITGTTATLFGYYNTDNYIPIAFEIGFFWGEDPNPGRNNNKVVLTAYNTLDYGYNYVLTDLKPNTKYYFRAFAENKNGTGYGNVMSFTTNEEESSFITITEAIPFAAYAIFARMSEEVNFPREYIKEWGFCIAEEKLPNLDDEFVVLENFGRMHVFYDLKGNTNYHVRAFAILKDDRVVYSSPEIVKTREIQMDTISKITFRSAVTATSIDFSENVLNLGVRWHTTTQPGFEESSHQFGINPYLMSNLEPETTYYVWPFVWYELYNSISTLVYGPYKTFTTPPLPDIGQGTFHDPYTTNGAIYLKTSDESVWVKGYIVGVPKSGHLYPNSAINNTEPFSNKWHILLAEDPDEVFMGNTLRVLLPEGEIQDNLNLVQNPENLGKEVMVEGVLHRYTNHYTFTGIRHVSGFVFIDEE